jgi:hypothetical protein
MESDFVYFVELFKDLTPFCNTKRGGLYKAKFPS